MMNKKIKDKVATVLLWGSGIIILVILLWFLYTILSKGLPQLSWKFLSTQPSEMDAGGGIGPEIFNTFYLLILSMIIAVPIGMGGGIYLAEFAADNAFTRFIRLCVEALASVPSIVFGLFGMIIFVQKLHLGFSILGGAATLALLNLPVIVRTTEESIRSVPGTYKEASFAVGSTHWQAISKVILPASLPGIITGINLAAGRAIGESAVLIFTAGTSVARHFPEFNPLASGEALSVHLWYVNSVALVPDGVEIAAGTSAVLILVILLFNLVMKIISKALKRKFEGQTA
jgi:phosphate transport system permease protein